MKKCTKCNVSKPVEQFYKKGKYRHSWCSSCFNTHMIAKWKQRKIDAIAYLGGCCLDCKNSFHPNVYDFHHLKDKDAQWNKLRMRSWAAIKYELDKCVLLCANCHRLRHV